MKAARGAQLALLGLIAALGVSLGLSGAARATSDPLDPSFGEGGFVVTPGAAGVVLDLAEDRNGRLIAAGTAVPGFLLARYLPDGTLDESFGPGTGPGPGITADQESGVPAGIAVQADGKILAAGSTDLPRESNGIALQRYLPNGKIDRGFGKKGTVVDRLGHDAGSGLAMGLQDDGRILVGGTIGPLPFIRPHSQSGLVVRYMPDGSLDRSFAASGRLRISAGRHRSAAITGIEALHGGKILASGNLSGRLLLERLLPDGSPDPRFGGDGRVATRIGHNQDCLGCPITSGIAIAPDGDVLVAGSTGGNSAVVRYHPNGRLDRRFGNGGVIRLRKLGIFGAARDVLVEPDGRIVVAGGTERNAVVLRFLPGGRPDPGFASSGRYSRGFRSRSQICTILQQPNGRLIAAGRADAPPISWEDDFPSPQFLILALRP